ncbi:MAG: hypothetical protein JXL84_23750 [Deltaproteobacteria bacterium]|nr:hypothetical protein [Deltaproteobacteria bacterium]
MARGDQMGRQWKIQTLLTSGAGKSAAELAAWCLSHRDTKGAVEIGTIDHPTVLTYCFSKIKTGRDDWI